MTQEHLQTLIERAVEKANADNNAKNVIRTGVRYEPEQSPNILSGVIDIYEAPHRFRLSKHMTNSQERQRIVLKAILMGPCETSRYNQTAHMILSHKTDW